MTTRLLVRAVTTTIALGAVIGMATLAQADTAPTVTLSSSVSGTTTDSTIPVTATFSEPVNNFGSGGLSLTNAGVSEFAGSGSVYTFNIEPLAAGAVDVSVPAGAAQGASNTPSLASNELAFEYQTQQGTGTPAVISNVQASNLASTTATITWNTDQPSDSQVFYGETPDYDASSAYDATYVTSHTSYLGGLLPGTLYHFDVASNDGAGLATSSDMTFTTTGAGGGGGSGSSTPLALIGIDTNQGNAIADGTYADGWQWTFHFLVPNDEPMFALEFSDFTGAGNIPADNVRYYSTESTNASSSASAITLTGANTFGSNLDFTNDFANSTTTGDTQVDIVVQAAVPTGTPNGSYSASWTADSTSTTP